MFTITYCTCQRYNHYRKSWDYQVNIAVNIAIQPIKQYNRSRKTWQPIFNHQPCKFLYIVYVPFIFGFSISPVCMFQTWTIELSSVPHSEAKGAQFVYWPHIRPVIHIYLYIYIYIFIQFYTVLHTVYPLVIKTRCGKSPYLMGKSTINYKFWFSIAT